MNDKNPRIKRHFSIIGHGMDVVELRHGVWNPIAYTLNDQSENGTLLTLLQNMDGSLSAAQLAKKVNTSRSDVEALIDHLLLFDAVEFGSESAFDHYLDLVAPPLKAMYQQQPVKKLRPLILGDPAIGEEVRRLIEAGMPDRVVECGADGDPGWEVIARNECDWFYDALAFERTMALFDGWKDRFVIYVDTVINPLRFQALNRASLYHGFPWLHAALDGPQLLIGPTFTPPHTACYDCFETRVTMNMRDTAGYVAYKNELTNARVTIGPAPIEPALVSLIASHTALESLNYLMTNYSYTRNKVLAIYLPTMEFAYNEVLKVPGCPGCGSVAERDEPELYFDLRHLINSNGNNSHE